MALAIEPMPCSADRRSSNKPNSIGSTRIKWVDTGDCNEQYLLQARCYFLLCIGSLLTDTHNKKSNRRNLLLVKFWWIRRGFNPFLLLSITQKVVFALRFTLTRHSLHLLPHLAKFHLVFEKLIYIGGAFYIESTLFISELSKCFRVVELGNCCYQINTIIPFILINSLRHYTHQ